jgi:hypothetical protein
MEGVIWELGATGTIGAPGGPPLADLQSCDAPVSRARLHHQRGQPDERVPADQRLSRVVEAV